MIKLALSDARNATAAANSSGRAIRPTTTNPQQIVRITARATNAAPPMRRVPSSSEKSPSGCANRYSTKRKLISTSASPHLKSTLTKSLALGSQEFQQWISLRSNGNSVCYKRRGGMNDGGPYLTMCFSDPPCTLSQKNLKIILKYS